MIYKQSTPKTESKVEKSVPERPTLKRGNLCICFDDKNRRKNCRGECRKNTLQILDSVVTHELCNYFTTNCEISDCKKKVFKNYGDVEKCKVLKNFREELFLSFVKGKVEFYHSFLRIRNLVKKNARLIEKYIL